MITVSIIIPAYNASLYIHRCITCCLEQTYSLFEIIVVNDGSIDDTKLIVDRISKIYDNIRIITKDNEGLVVARRTGLQYAKGEFVFFIDADDLIEPNALELLMHESENNDIVIGNIVLENSLGEKYPLQHTNKFLFGKDINGMYCNYLSKSITASLCGRIIRKKLFEAIYVPADMTIGEDFIANILMLQTEKIKVALVEEQLYHYIQYPSSMINTKNISTLLKRIQYVDWVINFLESSKAPSDKEVCHCLSHFVLGEYYAFLRDGGTPNLDLVFYQKIKKKFLSRKSLSKLSFWQSSLILSFVISPLLGKSYRKFFLFLRSKLQ